MGGGCRVLNEARRSWEAVWAQQACTRVCLFSCPSLSATLSPPTLTHSPDTLPASQAWLSTIPQTWRMLSPHPSPTLAAPAAGRPEAWAPAPRCSATPLALWAPATTSRELEGLLIVVMGSGASGGRKEPVLLLSLLAASQRSCACATRRPEIREGWASYDAKVDLFSLGVRMLVGCRCSLC